MTMSTTMEEETSGERRKGHDNEVKERKMFTFARDDVRGNGKERTHGTRTDASASARVVGTRRRARDERS